MSIIFYLTFVYLIFIVSYDFIYKKNLNKDNLFTIIINFIFLIILPLYYFYFEDMIYSILISTILLISSFFLNLKAKESFKKIKLSTLFYYLLTSLILSYIIIQYFNQL